MTLQEQQRILVIEDEPAIRELVCKLLDIHGFVTHGEGDGETGLNAAREWRPDALILDLMLPFVDGFEVCRQLRAEPPQEAVGILILSARSDHESRVRAFELGADRYLTKPFHPNEVLRELLSLRESPDGSEVGLRRRRRIDVVDGPNYRGQVDELVADLFHTTPMAPAEIAETCAVLLDVGRELLDHHAEDVAPGSVHLTCEIFDDRLRHVVNYDGEPNRSNGGWKAVRDAFSHESVVGEPSVEQKLGGSFVETLHPHELVLTRPFRSA
ncbi:DNA-binding response regulator MtrA [Planctomycetes bacterium Pan216]|uniref:DNA-binding response regulator MtrA n=1 Tax=Kolteria novifilia TaxID=2527975 RepID=A0A518B390_9BACT|nr:DNA-binding response regulator MtrA [Planctomycetes bacterium Pan216]